MLIPGDSGEDLETTLANASALFRTIRVDQLLAQDFSSSGVSVSHQSSSATPSGVRVVDEGGIVPLEARTVAAELGDCDAFLTHSWQDEERAPGQKYCALLKWAESFRAAHGREPTIWVRVWAGSTTYG